MWNALEESWISQETKDKLIARMPTSVIEVINFKGGYFDEKSAKLSCVYFENSIRWDYLLLNFKSYV